MLLAAFKASQDRVKLIGLDGRILYMNAGGSQLMELDQPGALVGELWVDLRQESARPRVREALSRACANQHDRFRQVCSTSRGTPKHWDVLLTPIVGDEGAETVVLVTSRDAPGT